jgi:hypothetical protein
MLAFSRGDLGMKVKLGVSTTEAADGSPLHWTDVSSDDDSTASGASEDESVNESDDLSYVLSEPVEAENTSMMKMRKSLFENNQIKNSTPIRKQPIHIVQGSNIKDKIQQFNQTNMPENAAISDIKEKSRRSNSNGRKSSIMSHDSGMSSALTTSQSSFNLHSNSSNHASEEEENARGNCREFSREKGAHVGTLRSQSLTSIAASRSASGSRMSRIAEREQHKLMKLMKATKNSSAQRRSRSIGAPLSGQARSQSQQEIVMKGADIKGADESRKSRAAYRAEKLNRKRWQSEPRIAEVSPSEKIKQFQKIFTTKDAKKGTKYTLDENKKEIRVALPPKIEIGKLQAVGKTEMGSRTQSCESVEQKNKSITITSRSGMKYRYYEE